MADWQFIISRIYVWFTRWNRCRGFGIQSPNDYAFVRDVINEHRKYYAYSSLKRKYRSLGAINRKKGELYLRVANYRQPTHVLDMVGNEDHAHDYILAGCSSCHILTEASEQKVLAVDMLRCRVDDLGWMEKMQDGVIIIVEPATGYTIKSKAWSQLVDRLPFGISYDLYYCGIIIIDKNRYKQNYIINF